MTLFPICYRIFSESLEHPITYSGEELRNHWLLEKTEVYGSMIGAFLGPCRVSTTSMVDQEDRLASDFIEAEKMLHFVAEFFGTSLEAAILYQRLFMVRAEKLLQNRNIPAERRGDDLFISGKKLSVS